MSWFQYGWEGIIPSCSNFKDRELLLLCPFCTLTTVVDPTPSLEPDPVSRLYNKRLLILLRQHAGLAESCHVAAIVMFSSFLVWGGGAAWQDKGDDRHFLLLFMRPPISLLIWDINIFPRLPRSLFWLSHTLLFLTFHSVLSPHTPATHVTPQLDYYTFSWIIWDATSFLGSYIYSFFSLTHYSPLPSIISICPNSYFLSYTTVSLPFLIWVITPFRGLSHLLIWPLHTYQFWISYKFFHHSFYLVLLFSLFSAIYLLHPML